ncbi:hypothetical protein EIP86_002133 [Pleurotus ostreatoroseus]|nr:hypothetical protein EIP86_002133 [Pleurotus ostreatoroseus]
MEVDNAVSDDNAKKVISMIVNNEKLKNLLATKHYLACIKFKIRYVENRKPAWTEAEMESIDDAVGKFMADKRGNWNDDDVVYYRSQHVIDEMEELWKTRYE